MCLFLSLRLYFQKLKVTTQWIGHKSIFFFKDIHLRIDWSNSNSWDRTEKCNWPV